MVSHYSFVILLQVSEKTRNKNQFFVAPQKGAKFLRKLAKKLNLIF